MGADPIMCVRDLTVEFDTPDGVVKAVNKVSFDLHANRCLGVVGESGSGKSQTFLALIAGVSSNGRRAGKVMFKGQDLLALPRRQIRKLRARSIAYVLQDALSSLTPHLTIEEQLSEGLMLVGELDRAAARKRIFEVLDIVRVPDAANRLKAYPHELSGGMRQRILIAMALLSKPEILIADEPTTALDVTVQAQMLDIFDELKRELELSLVLIAHDLGVVAGRADEVIVMYGGSIVEQAPVAQLFARPSHPYTSALLAAMPRFDRAGGGRLAAIPGQPPDLQKLPDGCAFAPRCTRAASDCQIAPPPLAQGQDGRSVACYHPVNAV